MKTIIVNLYGVPGAGKSTCGAYIYSNLKMKGVNVKMYWAEYIEDIWPECSEFTPQDIQLNIDILEDMTNPQVIINTFPAPMTDFLNQKKYTEEPTPHTLNYLLLRVKCYRSEQQHWTEAQSNEMALPLCKFLEASGMKYSAVGGHKEGFDCIIDDIMDKIEEMERWEQFQKCY